MSTDFVPFTCAQCGQHLAREEDIHLPCSSDPFERKMRAFKYALEAAKRILAEVEMSYCRWTADPNSLYVYEAVDDKWVCCCCPFIDKSGNRDPDGPSTDFVATSRPKMLQHLQEHVACGHTMGTAIERLEREIKEEP